MKRVGCVIVRVGGTNGTVVLGVLIDRLVRGTVVWVEKINIGKPHHSCLLLLDILKKDLFCIL